VGSWGESPDGYRVKTYRLATAGRRQLERETRQWKRIVLAVGQVLETE
jgi:DNA-binding PadR family transcriptional regulator